MKIIKFLVSIVLVVGLIGVGAYYGLSRFPGEKFDKVNENYQRIKPITDFLFSKVAETVPKNVQLNKVLGAQTGSPVASSSGSKQPQPFEQARYAYCQQVVKDYDNRYK